MAKRARPDFFLDLECMGGFFDDLDALIKQDILDLEKKARYDARRARNLPKAQRLYHRIKRVENFDLWKHTEHMLPDFFGDNTERFNEVKLLYAKQARILWTLRALSHYWAFDVPFMGSKPRRGLKYSVQRSQYDKNMTQFLEKLKQEKWDRKRERVRKRRQAKLDKKEGKVHDKKATAIATILRLKKPLYDPNTDYTW